MAARPEVVSRASSSYLPGAWFRARGSSKDAKPGWNDTGDILIESIVLVAV